MELCKPNKSGELFGLSARAIMKLEDCTCFLDAMVDEIRTMTCLPLDNAAQQLVAATFRTFARFDSVRRDLEFSLNELRKIRRQVSNG